MVRAIWRVFEEASSEERETMVAWRWDLTSRAEEGGVWFYGIPGLTRSEVVEEYSNLLAETLGIESLTLEDVERHFTWNKPVIHDIAWIRLRSSFYGSREWKEFRLEWLAEHPACVRCGRMDGILQVHHAGLTSLDETVMEEGFLEGLKHPERFETICRDCHELDHQELIKSEREIIRAHSEEKD